MGKPPSDVDKSALPNYAVVDTNAIIKGMRMEQLSAEAVTIQEARRSMPALFSVAAAARRWQSPRAHVLNRVCLE